MSTVKFEVCIRSSASQIHLLWKYHQEFISNCPYSI